MEYWRFSCAECQAVPTSCNVPVLSSSLTVLANGSQFLYFLDFKQKRKYAVVKFSSAVLHVASVKFANSEGTFVATCCLGDGRVAALSVSNIVKQAQRQCEGNGPSPITSEDIFSSLFDDPESSFLPPMKKRRRNGCVLSEDQFTVEIGHFLPSEWVLVSAVVYSDTLLVCRRSVATGQVSLVLLKSSVSAEVPSGGRETITMPSFVEAQHLQSLVVISPGRGSCRGHGVLGNVERGGAVLMDCKPVLFSLVCSRGSPSMGPLTAGSDATISSELFSSLFGCQVEHPIFLIGCQNGNIYYTDFLLRRPSTRIRSSTSSTSSSTSSDDGDGVGAGSEGLLCPLYSLDEPMIGIHSAHFPRCRQPPETASLFRIQEETDLREESSDMAHNALIFLGQSGKIVICHAASDDGKSAPPNFLEYRVPSPILSTMLVPDQCLLYSSPQGIHRICLRPQCADTMEEKLPRLGTRQPLRIPQVSFMFPEKVCESDCGLHLLQMTTRCDDSESERNLESCDAEMKTKSSLHCMCLSFDGGLFTFHCSRPGEGQDDAVHCKDSTQVGQEIKQCLQVIQTQGEKIDALTKKISLLNSLLSELKSALDVLCAVKEAYHSSPLPPFPAPLTTPSPNLPLTCTFRVFCESIGIQVERHCVVVELKLNSAQALGSGWYVLVNSFPSLSECLAASSKSVSLSGLTPGASATVKMDVEVCGVTSVVGGGGDGSAGCIIVECLVHYNPQHLQDTLPGRATTGTARPFKSVSLPMARQEFSVLDFLGPAATSPAAIVSSRETLPTCQHKMVKSLLSSSQGEDLSRPIFRATFVSLPHVAKLAIPVGVAVTGVRAVASVAGPSTSSSSEPQRRDMEDPELASEFLKVLVPTAGGVRKLTGGRGGARGGAGATELCWGVDGGVVQLRIGPAVGQGSGTTSVLNLEIRTSNKTVLVALVGIIGRRLQAIATSSALASGHTPRRTVSHASSAGHTSLARGSQHRTSGEEVSVKLEQLKQLLQEVNRVLQEMGVAFNQRRSKRMNAEALDNSKNKTLNLYCRLREIF